MDEILDTLSQYLRVLVLSLTWSFRVLFYSLGVSGVTMRCFCRAVISNSS